jgi:glycosyltransferase involved in cell wall biosynthesis
MVEFRGAVSASEASTLLRGARALLFPSTCYEGSPRVIAEAYAAGVPVIGTAIGGIPEVIEPHVTGVLVRPRGTGGWRSAIEELLDDTTSERFGQGAWLKWRDDYSPDCALRALETVYSDVMSGRTRPLVPTDLLPRFARVR